MSRSRDTGRWAVTFAHQRAVTVTGLGGIAAVVWQRPGLLVLVTPLLVVLVWSGLTRPRRVPEVRARLTRPVVTEGDRGYAVVRTGAVEHCEVLGVSLADAPWVAGEPLHGATVHVVDERDRSRGASLVPTAVRALRWGSHRVGPVAVAGLSPWGAFRWGPVTVDALPVRVLPRTQGFDVRAPAPHPRGLVGRHRASRPGEGSEFRSTRPFQWGDRLRRIHWARSLRTGELHVTSSYADEDTHVAVVVDAYHDLGVSEGVDGAASTLDHTVRAAASVAEHFLHQGDRVSLRVWSGRTPARIPPGTGRRHHRRILETLAVTRPAPQEHEERHLALDTVGAGTLVVLVSALISPAALTRAATLARHGTSVVVIDAFVEGVEPPEEDDEVAGLAWRIRMLERDRELRRIQQEGVPVVPWQGAGSLDEVLRRLARRGPRVRVEG